MAGVYSRVDGSRGVWKAPANVSLHKVIEPLGPYKSIFAFFLELGVQMLVGCFIASQDHHPTGKAIQPVNNPQWTILRRQYTLQMSLGGIKTIR